MTEREMRLRIDGLERALEDLIEWADEFMRTGKAPTYDAVYTARCVRRPADHGDDASPPSKGDAPASEPKSSGDQP